MSAITGIFYRDGRKVDHELIKKMNNKLSHRGPDGSDVSCEGPVALGHQMLWTTPESLHERLPFEEEDLGLVITADARIDNRDELSKELYIKDKEEVSDSYFILKAYEKWGEDCPDKLLGDFAFVIWDKNEEKLFCARDHMGVKSFYYYLDDKIFVFGTEIKALLTIPEVPYELNELQLAFYLTEVYDERTFTFYESIYRLPAAHSVTITNEKLNLQKYWELDPNLKIEMNSDEEYAQKFLEIFTEAVRCRLRSAGPVGFELSGGLDSSSVVCVAKKILTTNNNVQLNTFSIVTEIAKFDERYYMEKVMDLGGIKPHYLNADEISPLDNMETILWYLDQPFYANNRSIYWILYKKMQKNNIRVLLTGMEGDATVSHGKNYLIELATNFKFKKLIKEINIRLSLYDRKLKSVLVNELILPNFPDSIMKLFELNIKKKPKVLFNNKEFINKVNYKKYFNIYQKYIFTSKSAKERHYKELTHGMIQSVLEVEDQNIAPFFIEQRHPFYDKRLIEFCFSVPTEQKIRSGWGRWLLRLAMDGILPKENQWRLTKNNFSTILLRNLLLFEEKKLDDLIFNDNDILKDYIDLDEFRNIYQRYKCQNNFYDYKLIEKLIILMIWLKQIEIKKK